MMNSTVSGRYRLTSSNGLPWLDLDQPQKSHWAARGSAAAGIVGIASNALDFSTAGSLLSIGLLTIPPAAIYVRAGTATVWQTISRAMTGRRDRKKPPGAATLLAVADGITEVRHDGLEMLRTPDGYLLAALVTAPSSPDARDDAGSRWGEMLTWAGDTIPGIRLALTTTSGPTGRSVLNVPAGLQGAARAIAGRACEYRSYLTAFIPARKPETAADAARGLFSQAAATGMTLAPLACSELSRLMSAQMTGATRWPEDITPGSAHCTTGDRNHAVARAASWPQRPVTVSTLDRLVRGEEEAIKTVTVLMAPYTSSESHTKHRRWAQIHDGYRDERAARGQRTTVKEARSSQATDLDFHALADGACLVKTDVWITVTHPDAQALASARSSLDTAAGVCGVRLDWMDGVHHRHLLHTTPLGVLA